MFRRIILKRLPPSVALFLITIVCLIPPVSDSSHIRSSDAFVSFRQDLIARYHWTFENAVRFMNSGSTGEAENIMLNIIGNDLPEKEKALFLLGMLYKEEGITDDAENYLQEAAEGYPLLRDYALKLLTEIYVDLGNYEEALTTVRQIKSRLLLEFAMQSEISVLLELNRQDEAEDVLLQYIEKFPNDWDRKLTLALLLKERGETDQAIQHFKEIYIHAIHVSDSALKELKLLKADIFLRKELLERAGNLYKRNNFQQAEFTYKKVLRLSDDSEKKEIIFLIGMCQFRQKHYGKSAKTFGLIETPRGLYWQARSFYRRDERDNFNRTKDDFERRYPTHHRLALLFLMDAHESRRSGLFHDAERNYRIVLDRFPDKTEDALWGLGWLNYVSGNYKDAADYFSRLSTYSKSRDYYKYLFWKARSREKMSEGCIEPMEDQKNDTETDRCNLGNENFFKEVPADNSYYGYLIKLRSKPQDQNEKIEFSEPAKPEGEEYDRIEALALLGLRDETVAEILHSFKRVKTREELFYLGHMAMKLGEYRRVILFAEAKKEREFLPFSYPLGYWDTVKPVADSRNMDAHLIAAVIREESRYDPGVVSWAGAVGLMQLMPSTAKRLKKEVQVNLEDMAELKVPEKNIALGTHYLSQLINEFKELPFAIAAYNAGEHNLKKWMARFNKEDVIEFIENIPYRETRRYVKKVLKSYWQYRMINGLPIQDDRLMFGGYREAQPG